MFIFNLIRQGYPDEYVLEDLEMTIADYVQRAMKANFGAAWEELASIELLVKSPTLSTAYTT